MQFACVDTDGVSQHNTLRCHDISDLGLSKAGKRGPPAGSHRPNTCRNDAMYKSGLGCAAAVHSLTKFVLIGSVVGDVPGHRRGRYT
jgi:hypothetical protein